MSTWFETQYTGYWVNTRGEVKGKRGKLLAVWQQQRGGYPAVKISNGRSDTKTICVHTLVLTTFIGPRPDGMEACHRNGDPTDNRVENLYWGTKSDNMQDMLRHETYAKTRPTNRGSQHHMAKLTEIDVLNIRRQYVRGNGQRLAEEYGVGCGTISSIINRKTWTHV